MIDASIALAFAAGMVATVNPCGFAMLPAYLSYFLGMEDRSRDARAGVLRALAVGLCVSAGFMAVFAIMGLVLTRFSQEIEPHLPWVTIVIGFALIALGIAMVRGYVPVISLPKLTKGTKSRQLSSMFVFGVSYAVCSLSCTLPLFSVNVARVFTTKDFFSGVIGFIAYTLGMALVLMALTLALALTKQGLVQRLRRSGRFINRLSGVFLVGAGAYVAYYGWYSLQVYANNDPGGPASTVYRWNSEIADWIKATGPERIGIVLAGAILFAVLVATAWRSTGTSRSRSRAR